MLETTNSVTVAGNGAAKTHHQDPPSSDTDVSDDEDEDPSEIDW